MAFTRNPSHGRERFYGEFLVNAQGEDVVAGIRTPKPVSEMSSWNRRCISSSLRSRTSSRAHYKDMQDIEFTIERGKLYMLQTRTGKRTGAAAVKIACGHGEGEADHRGGGAAAHPGGRSDPAPAAELRPRGARNVSTVLHGAARLARRGGGQAGLHRRRSRRANARRARACCWCAGDEPRGHRRHARGRGHPDQHGRHDQPRGRRGPRLGQVLRRRRGRDPRSTPRRAVTVG